MSYRTNNAGYSDFVPRAANGSWAGSRIPAQNGHTGNGISQKLEDFFDNRQLPMYKDKPYSYAASTRKPPLYRRWQIILGAMLVISGLSYTLGLFTPTRVKRGAYEPGKIDLSQLMPGLTAVEWEERRERVRDAFILSWDGYERYAWGKSI